MHPFTQDRWESRAAGVVDLRALPSVAHHCPSLFRGTLTLLVGASHNGKTQVALTLVNANPNVSWVIMTPDESAEVVAVKLLAMRTGAHPSTIRGLGAGWTWEQFIAAWEHHFPRVWIREDSYPSADSLNLAFLSAEETFVERGFPDGVDAVVFDYVGLMPKEGDDPRGSVALAKRFCKDRQVCGIFLQQVARSNAKGGQVSITSGFFGGEEFAELIIGAWMPSFDPENYASADILMLNVPKNKMLPGGTHDASGSRYRFHESGLVSSIYY